MNLFWEECPNFTKCEDLPFLPPWAEVCCLQLSDRSYLRVCECECVCACMCMYVIPRKEFVICNNLSSFHKEYFWNIIDFYIQCSFFFIHLESYLITPSSNSMSSGFLDSNSEISIILSCQFLPHLLHWRSSLYFVTVIVTSLPVPRSLVLSNFKRSCSEIKPHKC